MQNQDLCPPETTLTWSNHRAQRVLQQYLHMLLWTSPRRKIKRKIRKIQSRSLLMISTLSWTSPRRRRRTNRTPLLLKSTCQRNRKRYADHWSVFVRLQEPFCVILLLCCSLTFYAYHCQESIPSLSNRFDWKLTPLSFASFFSHFCSLLLSRFI